MVVLFVVGELSSPSWSWIVSSCGIAVVYLDVRVACEPYAIGSIMRELRMCSHIIIQDLGVSVKERFMIMLRIDSVLESLLTWPL